MTDLDLAAIRERHAAAKRTFAEIVGRYQSSAPWIADGGEVVYHGPSVLFYDAIMADLPALLADVERLREIAREAQRVREMLDSDGVGGVDWFNLSMVLDAYRLEATHD